MLFFSFTLKYMLWLLVTLPEVRMQMYVCHCFPIKVATVEGFINSVDSQMRQRQEQQKLATISARIDCYEAVEGSSEEVEKVRNTLQYPSALKLDFMSNSASCLYLSPLRSSRSTTTLTSWLPWEMYLRKRLDSCISRARWGWRRAKTVG